VEGLSRGLELDADGPRSCVPRLGAVYAMVEEEGRG